MVLAAIGASVRQLPPAGARLSSGVYVWAVTLTTLATDRSHTSVALLVIRLRIHNIIVSLSDWSQVFPSTTDTPDFAPPTTLDDDSTLTRLLTVYLMSCLMSLAQRMCHVCRHLLDL